MMNAVRAEKNAERMYSRTTTERTLMLENLAAMGFEPIR